jgi:hypothetical protein
VHICIFHESWFCSDQFDSESNWSEQDGSARNIESEDAEWRASEGSFIGSGNPVRAITAGVVGFVLALLVLPHTPLVHSLKELNAGCWICAAVFAAFAGTYA